MSELGAPTISINQVHYLIFCYIRLSHLIDTNAQTFMLNLVADFSIPSIKSDNFPKITDMIIYIMKYCSN